ncbi:MAG TPA: hypothetical protein VGZ47_19865, partial [Gemmataceae bacterium]|nr:hypothetical protein [Gemmataceae bacterium]
MLELRDSRQLQAFHEVSQDSCSWQTAGSIENLFPSKITAQVGAQPPLPTANNWGTAAATPDASDPLPPQPSTRSFPLVWLIAGGVCLLICALGIAVGVVAYLRYGKSGGFEDLATSGVIELSPHTDPAEIDRALQDVVGLVVSGGEVVRRDGSRAEILGGFYLGADDKPRPFPGSTGSCFSITKDGFLITNQHVVADVARLQESRDLKDYAI